MSLYAEPGRDAPGTQVPEQELPGSFTDAGSTSIPAHGAKGAYLAGPAELLAYRAAAAMDEVAGQDQFTDGKS